VILTSDPIPADEALRIGLVNRTLEQPVGRVGAEIFRNVPTQPTQLPQTGNKGFGNKRDLNTIKTIASQ
jgi:enoyl-CoA hydratase/carnithine racemase